MKTLTLLTALLLLACGAAFAADAQIAIDTRETALAATLDMEFQDAMPRGVSGAAILEQDGKVALRASYGRAGANHAPFTTQTRVPAALSGMTLDTSDVSASDLYTAFRVAPLPAQDGANGWTLREAADGHVLQVSHTGSDGVHFVYLFHRPDDGTLLVLILSGDDKVAKALRDRMLVSLRDYGKMPVTDMH